MLTLYDSIERLNKSRKILTKVFDFSVFGFSGRKLLGATKSVG